MLELKCNRSKGGAKMKNTIILILSLLVIGLGSYVIFDKVIDKNNTNTTNNNSNNQSTQQQEAKTEENSEKTEETNIASSSYTTKCNADEPKTFTVYGNVDNYSNIYQYISDKKNISVKFGYCSDEPVSDDGEGPVYYKANYYSLTSKEIVEYLNEMKVKGSSKYLEGGYGPSCDDSIYISYNFNNVDYTVKLGAGSQILDSSDGNIYKIIDTNSKEKAPQYCLYSAGSVSDTINNIREKLK